jgi:DUF4097 and DUF4098 domain-containing protein YvlB
MRRRSFTGPLMMLIVGGAFLWRNLHPETPLFDIVSLYWPYLLIGWGFLRLIEALVWNRQGYRSGFGGGEVVLIVLICIVGSGVWQARQHGVRFVGNGLDLWSQSFDYPVSARTSGAGIKRIVFENPRGNIKVTGGDSQDVEITGRKTIRASSRQDADRTNDATPVEFVPQGDRLVVRTHQDRGPSSQRISDDLEVVVPRSLAVEARANTADYEIADVAGDVELASEHGDARLARIGGNVRLDMAHSELIRASAVTGKLDLDGQGSDIDLENMAGQVTVNGAYHGSLDFKNLAKALQFEGTRNTELHVAAAPGRISMDLGQFSATNVVGPMRLVGGSRDVKIEQFTNALELETQRGDVELTPGHLPLAAMDVRSGSGKIDLVLPPKATFTMEATAQAGDATSDFADQIVKAVDGRTATLKGRVGDGPTIRLTATRGWISVRKEGSLPSAPEPPKRMPKWKNGVPEPPQPPAPPKGTAI